LPYRLLCITAHPDDESGTFGAALLMAHRDGVETSVLCLTDGQAAHFRGESTDPNHLAQLRRAEFSAACEVLGVTQHKILDYPDGGLPQQDFYALTGVLIEYIRKWRPQVVLTFGGDGSVNLHRDHTTLSLAATAAFHWVRRPEFFPAHLEQGLEIYSPQKLYYHSAQFIAVRNRPELADSPTVPYSLTLVLGDLAEKKFEAVKKHVTQTGLIEHFRKMPEEYKDSERYLLAASHGQIAIHEDKALFAGVTPD
jgi:LmbE family N-acetylglucosaminyl deacetylase